MPDRQTDLPPSMLVIPVRYVSEGAIVQTTSTSLTTDLIHVRSVRPPRAGMVLGLQLYFPNVREVVRSVGLVTEVTAEQNPGFWAELSDTDNSTRKIAALVARQRDTGDRGLPRFHSQLRVAIRRDSSKVDGQITNISRSG